MQKTNEQKQQTAPALNPADNQKKLEKVNKQVPLVRQKGGIYFYSGAIIGKKNVFVTNEYLDLMVNSFKEAELKKDIKNLAYVVMPNFFYWMFRLSTTQDDPVSIYGEVKKNVALGILNNLRNELSNGSYPLADIFVNNERVGRSHPGKIIGNFKEYGAKFKENKKYRIWAPHTEIRLMDSDELLAQKLEVIKKAPVSDRWQMVSKVEDYPYYFLADELSEDGSRRELNPTESITYVKTFEKATA